MREPAPLSLAWGSRRPLATRSRLPVIVRSESGAKLRGTAASAARAGAAGVPVDARSPRHITGRVLWDTWSRGAAKGARIQAECPQGGSCYETGGSFDDARAVSAAVTKRL